jgi:ABC-2 type transport system permease protein
MITKYFAIAKVNFISGLTYIKDVVASSLFIGLIIYVFANLWGTIYANQTLIEGFTLIMILWYLVMTESIVTSHGGVLEDIGDDVISGNIANYLTKPYNYILYRYANTIGYALVKFLLTFIIGGTILLMLAGPISIQLVSIPFILVIILLAISLHFIIMALLGIFALWFEDSRALAFIYSKIVFTIGGMLLPLDFFPIWLAKISELLPFSYIAYYPAKLFVDFSFKEFIRIFAVEIMWITIISGLTYIAYKIYIKKLSVNGG